MSITCPKCRSIIDVNESSQCPRCKHTIRILPKENKSLVEAYKQVKHICDDLLDDQINLMNVMICKCKEIKKEDANVNG